VRGVQQSADVAEVAPTRPSRSLGRRAGVGNPPQVPPSGHRGHRRAGGKQYALRGAESFWYILGCISFGAAYFSKRPGKKAACEVFSELQLDGQGPSGGYSLRGAEGFSYVLMCIPLGAGYFAKVSAKKALGNGRYGAVRARRVRRGDQPRPLRRCSAVPAPVLTALLIPWGTHAKSQGWWSRRGAVVMDRLFT
jgi:hypothetical protein